MQKKAFKFLWIGAACLFLVLGTFKIYSYYQEKNTPKNQSISEITTDVSCEKNALKTTETNSKEEQNHDSFLQNFGDKWLNYSSIDERNQSVKEWFTNEAREENGLDVQVDASIDWKGKVQSIYRQTDEKNNYIVVGSEEANGNKNIIVLFVELTSNDQETKIKKLTVSYVRQAY